MQILNKISNIYWLISLLSLIALTGWVYFSGEDSMKNYDESKFTLELNSIITSVRISGENSSLNFDYVNGIWMVDDSLQMDPGMRDAFFTVISSIRIKRPAGISERDSLKEYLQSEGLRVEILNNANLVKSYRVGGNELTGVSYFMDESDGIPYEVVLPGYDSYVAGIYAVPEIDWRNRFVFELDWSNLKSVNVAYFDEEEDVKIEYREDFFYLNNDLEPIDSALMFDYLGELRNLQAQKYLMPRDNPVYDSLRKTGPKASVRVEVIGVPAQELLIYNRAPGDRWVLGRLGENLLVQFDPRSLVPILIQPGALEE